MPPPLADLASVELGPEAWPSPRMHTDEIHPGDVIGGKYRVRAILGRGHGLLVEAFHTEFDQRVVIKLLLAGHGDDREIERFRREARILAKLESEHVARIIDVGTEEDGSFYLVRQYLEGIDLASYLRQSGPLPLSEAVLAILMVAEALAETHSHGIIVRELQPSHLFLTQRPGGAPLMKIADFGTAKLMRDAAAPGVGPELTATAMFGLSPYSSPELVRKARNVDARTDVWSLGAIFYELLTGRPPFTGEAAFLMLQITKEDPEPVAARRPDLPPEIDQIIGWALAKDFDARFKNVHAFAHALAPYASPEAQVLIARIGQITEAAKTRKRTGSVPPPSFPSARPPAPPPSVPTLPPPPSARAQHGLPERQHALEDSVTGVRAPASTPAPAMGSQPPPAPGARARGIPPPPPGQPIGSMWATSSPSSDVGAASGPHIAPPTEPATRQVDALPSQNRRLVIGAIAAAAVLISLVVVLLLVRKPAEAPVETQAATVQVTASAPAGEAPAAPVAQATTASPVATEAPAAGSAAPADTGSAAPPAQAAADPPPAAATPAKKAVKVSAAPAPAPAAAAGGNGTLLALAVGGSCAFSVNGAGKGTSSSIRLALKPGNYSITCRPATGATKSKSVTVKAGETAMATFKL